MSKKRQNKKLKPHRQLKTVAKPSKPFELSNPFEVFVNGTNKTKQNGSEFTRDSFTKGKQFKTGPRKLNKTFQNSLNKNNLDHEGPHEFDSNFKKMFKTNFSNNKIESRREKLDRTLKNQSLSQKTQTLNNSWKKLVQLSGNHFNRQDEIVKSTPNDYDRLTKELIFERCGSRPTKPLKPVSEILESVETAMPEHSTVNQKTIKFAKEIGHVSADAIDEFAYNETTTMSDEEEVNLSDQEQYESNVITTNDIDKEESEPHSFDSTSDTFSHILNWESFINSLKTNTSSDVEMYLQNLMDQLGKLPDHVKKSKFLLLFAYIFRYLNYELIDLNIQDYCSAMNALVFCLYLILKKFPIEANKMIVDEIIRKHDRYIDIKSLLVETVMFIKLILFLYPNFDENHPILLAAVAFSNQIITNFCSDMNPKKTPIYILLSHILIEYFFESKKNPANLVQFTLSLLTQRLKPQELVTTLPLLHKLLLLFNNTSLVQCVASSIENNLNSINSSSYTSAVQLLINNLLQECQMSKRIAIQFIRKEAKKPKMLRQLAPFQQLKNPKNQMQQDSIQSLMLSRQKVQTKIKREIVARKREMRKDTVQYQRNKLKQQVKSDRKRKEKVKRIFAEASVQQAEFKSLHKKTKK